MIVTYGLIKPGLFLFTKPLHLVLVMVSLHTNLLWNTFDVIFVKMQRFKPWQLRKTRNDHSTIEDLDHISI